MNPFKWKKRKWTLVLIPEADRSVVRFRLSNLTLYIASAVLLAILLASAVIYILHLRLSGDMLRIKSQLSAAAAEYDKTVASRDETIDELKNEIIRLSQQARDMDTKVDEMAKLENDLKAIAQIDGNGSGQGVAPGSGAEGETGQGEGEGGDMIPATDEQIEELSTDTSESFLEIGARLNALKSSFTQTKRKMIERQQLLRITPTLWPTASQVVTSPFGYRTDPLNGKPSFHSGIDIGASVNEPVYAAADGIVVSAGKDATHGNNIRIDHGQGMETWYMHLNKMLVGEGDQVQKGQQIGLVGSTGRSTGPHLHYEVIENGKSIDPRPYLQTTREDES